MTTMHQIPNGPVRKNLASQLDRLDRILDGLADGLQEAVVGAVKEAVTVAVEQAVRAVLKEVLTNPDLLAKLRGTAVGAEPAQPAPVITLPRLRLKERAVRLGRWLTTSWRGLRGACGARWHQLRQGAALAWARRRLVPRFKYQLLAAGGVGLAAGVATFFAGPWLASAAGGLGGFAMTLAVQAGVALRRLFVTGPASDA